MLAGSEEAKSIAESQHLPGDATLLDINVFGDMRKKKNDHDDESLALCLKPFHNNYDKAIWLVEFVEYYRIMGRSYVLLYIRQASASSIYHFS